ncbi:MAG: sigma-70 family RNA polymerase sigma factor [Candidatus Margulisbacteria bacterium]|nr:sigma-70 family RNA polymerase sigma factor [Candidatus Margulisiibacteriota bacterium]
MGQLEFNQVYAGHNKTVWRLISRYVSSQHDREDLFQEVFLRIHRALPKFRADSSLSTWIYRITVNTSLNFLKKQKRHAGLKDLLGSFRLIEVEEQSETQEPDKTFEPLQKLNPQQRMLLIMAEVEERKISEISEILNLPVGTVKSNLSRAREILKKELKDNDIL